MKNLHLLFVAMSVLFSACGQETVEAQLSEPEVVLGPIDLNSFLTDRTDLSEKVDSVFNSMSVESKVA